MFYSNKILLHYPALLLPVVWPLFYYSFQALLCVLLATWDHQELININIVMSLCYIEQSRAK
jgi:hypothetical protein